MAQYLVPFENAQSEFTEKRSRFIGHVFRVESEAEARERIEQVRKQHYDARHNCWCYVIHEGGVVRYSDDGEPQGTAGQPMLNVFQREGVENVVCIVTRYFGHPRHPRGRGRQARGRGQEGVPALSLRVVCREGRA